MKKFIQIFLFTVLENLLSFSSPLNIFFLNPRIVPWTHLKAPDTFRPLVCTNPIPCAKSRPSTPPLRISQHCQYPVPMFYLVPMFCPVPPAIAANIQKFHLIVEISANPPKQNHRRRRRYRQTDSFQESMLNGMPKTKTKRIQS